jgi:hypothetical protein
MSNHSIRIAGAGLAGLSAAIGLARRGHRVEVFEKNADSGAARHSDWDAIENWTTEEDMLELLGACGIAPSFEHRSRLDFEVYDKDGVCYPVATPRPFFYLLKRGPDRGSVEQELKRQALDHGVAIHYGQPRARADVDIWAAGSQHGGFFLGAGMIFRTSHPDLMLGLVSTQAAPKAYAYLVIVDGQGTLSVVLTRDFRQAREYLSRSIAIFRVLPIARISLKAVWRSLLSAWKPSLTRSSTILRRSCISNTSAATSPIRDSIASTLESRRITYATTESMRVLMLLRSVRWSRCSASMRCVRSVSASTRSVSASIRPVSTSIRPVSGTIASAMLS